MSVRYAVLATSAFFIFSTARATFAANWYVDASVAVSGDGKTPATAFKTIQQGINAASNGDTVTVAEGTYVENIKFNGKNIVLTSANPSDLDVVLGTIIDGNQAGPVVTFSGSENGTCALSGFTIRNGKAEYGGGILGRASGDVKTGATIRNNVIGGNSAQGGGGISDCGGVIRDNTITRNSAYDGGGIYGCWWILEGNVISENSATNGGGGLFGCTDAEGDDMMDYWEIKYFGDLSHVGNADTDLNELTDAEECAFRTDPTSGDTDGDGSPDAFELAAGTDPSDSHSSFLVVSVTYATTGTTIEWSAVGGKRYQVYVSAVLESWTFLGKPVVASPGTQTMSIVHGAAPGLRKSFYKVGIVS